MPKKPTYIELCTVRVSILLICSFMFVYNGLYAQSIVGATKDSVPKVDSVKTVKTSSALSSKVTYSALDSMIFDIVDQKIYLYGQAEVYYEQIALKAANIQLDMKNNIVAANGVKDSAGKETGNPEFMEGTSKFNAKSMIYNFETKKGRINEVLTQEGDGFIHGETIKKSPHDEYYIKNGKYTTCNDPTHPHFYIKAAKLKIIPEDKIVTGAADLYILDVPSPLMVPFGFFPNKKGRKSGIIIPKPGNTQSLGISLKQGGYYWGVSDKIDLAILGDIYSRGSYGLGGATNYANRYKYNGLVTLQYSLTKFGFKDDKKNYNETKNFGFHWRHSQDPKAHPTRTFNAEVNLVSNKFNTYNRTSAQDILNNSFNSNINYNKRFANTPFSLSAYASQSQTTVGRQVNVVLPGAALTMNQIYPFKRKNAVGNPRWYENVGFTYTSNIRNEITTRDTSIKDLLHTDTLFNKMKNGMQHTAALSTNFKALKFVSVSPSINYTENWYTKSMDQYSYVTRNHKGDNDSTVVKTDTLKGFKQSRNVSFNINTSTKVYGMFQFNKGRLMAVRHVMTPALGFVYVPVIKTNPVYGVDPVTKKDLTYDPYLGSFTNAYNQINQGNITFNLQNNFEAKAKANKKDSSDTSPKKVKLLEYLNIGAAYNIFADSLNLSNINIDARNNFFEKFNVVSRVSLDPYSYNDSTGVKVNRFQYKATGNLARVSNAILSVNFDLRSKSKKATPVPLTTAQSQEMQMIRNNPYYYVDFNVPWNVSIAYTLNYTETKQLKTKSVVVTNTNNNIIQSVTFRGDVNITSKWKVGFNSGIDIRTGKLTYTNIDIYRDLHCWEMRFSCVPFGSLRSYSFDLNVKSSVLQDLRLNRKRNWTELR